MPVLISAIEDWYCPNCMTADRTIGLPPNSARMHTCPGLHMLTAPLIRAGVRCKVTAEVREAYLDGEIYLHGRDIARSSVTLVGECAVIASSFLMRFPERCVATPSFELEQAFRLRLEAQHGWSFDSSWPSAAEAVSLAARLPSPA